MVESEDIYERAYRRFQNALKVAEEKNGKEIIEMFVFRAGTSLPVSELLTVLPAGWTKPPVGRAGSSTGTMPGPSV